MNDFVLQAGAEVLGSIPILSYCALLDCDMQICHSGVDDESTRYQNNVVDRSFSNIPAIKKC